MLLTCAAKLSDTTFSLLFHDQKIHSDTIDHNKLIISFFFPSLLSQELSPFHVKKRLTLQLLSGSCKSWASLYPCHGAIAM